MNMKSSELVDHSLKLRGFYILSESWVNSETLWIIYGNINQRNRTRNEFVSSDFIYNCIILVNSWFSKRPSMYDEYLAFVFWFKIMIGCLLLNCWERKWKKCYF